MALPLSAVAGTAITILISVALGPLFILGLLTGFDRTARRVIGFFAAVAIVAWLLTRGPFAQTLPDPGAAGGGGQGVPSPIEQMVTVSLGGLVLLGLVVGVLVLVALWMRRVTPPVPGVEEERWIDMTGGPPDRRRRRWWLRARSEPTNAVAAYVALVDDLDRHAHVRREPAETPAEHAARLRAIGRSRLSLDLLAADYALARYGGLALAPHEDRRAIGRWRMLRRRIPAVPPGWIVPTDDAAGGRVPSPDVNPVADVAVKRTL